MTGNRLDLMDDAVRRTGLRAVELGFYGSIGGVLGSIATYRYRKAPYFIIFGIGTGMGMALIEGNARLREQIEGPSSQQSVIAQDAKMKKLVDLKNKLFK